MKINVNEEKKKVPLSNDGEIEAILSPPVQDENTNSSNPPIQESLPTIQKQKSISFETKTEKYEHDNSFKLDIKDLKDHRSLADGGTF